MRYEDTRVGDTVNLARRVQPWAELGESVLVEGWDTPVGAWKIPAAGGDRGERI